MDEGIDYKRVITISCCTLISAVAFLIPKPLLVNTDLYTDLLTVVSILCGVLIAVISILGAEPKKTSSQAYLLHTISTESKMTRLRMQFYLYLLVITTALVCKLFNADEGFYSIALYKITLFLGTLSLLTSFSLPRLLSDAFKHVQHTQH